MSAPTIAALIHDVVGRLREGQVAFAIDVPVENEIDFYAAAITHRGEYPALQVRTNMHRSGFGLRQMIVTNYPAAV